MPKVDTKITPGVRYGHRIEGKTIAETWVKIIHRIRTTGTIRPTGYGGEWQELIDLTAVITDEPEGFYFPSPNYLPCTPESVKDYIPQVLDDAPYKEGVKYTYGQRIRSWFGRDQVEDVVKKLVNEIDAASAVICLWDAGSGNFTALERHIKAFIKEEWKEIGGGDTCFEPNKLFRYGREMGDSDHQHGGSPCLNHIWIRVVDNEMSMTCLFRSQDMFVAWPSNVMGLRSLQIHIRDEISKQSKKEIQLDLGPLIVVSQSAHIYDDCWQNASKLIDQQYESIRKREQKQYDDPSGNFVVSSEDGKNLKVEHLTPQGELVQTFEGRIPQNIVNDIERKVPGIQPGHMGYIAIQLSKTQTNKQERPNYSSDESYFMAIAHTVATRSTCLSQQVGAVIVDTEGHILSTGYNKSPRNCYKKGSCYDNSPGCKESTNPSMAVHAEISALTSAAYTGTSIKGASIYVTNCPCINCLKAITGAGIRKVFVDSKCAHDYSRSLKESEVYEAFAKQMQFLFCH